MNQFFEPAKLISEEKYGLYVLRSIPSEELYRLAVDGVLQENGQGWVAYENREPGCIRAVMHALSLAMENLQDLNITAELIQSLHDACISDVEEIRYDNSFRISGVNFSISRQNYSIHGLEDLLDWIDSKTPESRSVILRNYRIGKIIRAANEESKQDNKTVARQLYEDFDASGDEIKFFTSDSSVEESVRILVSFYNSALEETDIDIAKRLRLIAEIIYRFEHLHPFYDANLRTFGITLLDRLLVQNGLPPVMFYNPNCIDGFSIDEIVDEIKWAMLTSVSFAAGNLNMFGFSSENIPDEYKVKYPDMVNEFTSHVEILCQNMKPSKIHYEFLPELKDEQISSAFQLGAKLCQSESEESVELLNSHAGLIQSARELAHISRILKPESRLDLIINHARKIIYFSDFILILKSLDPLDRIAFIRTMKDFLSDHLKNIDHKKTKENINQIIQLLPSETLEISDIDYLIPSMNMDDLCQDYKILIQLASKMTFNDANLFLEKSLSGIKHSKTKIVLLPPLSEKMYDRIINDMDKLDKYNFLTYINSQPENKRMSFILKNFEMITSDNFCAVYTLARSLQQNNLLFDILEKLMLDCGGGYRVLINFLNQITDSKFPKLLEKVKAFDTHKMKFDKEKVIVQAMCDQPFSLQIEHMDLVSIINLMHKELSPKKFLSVIERFSENAGPENIIRYSCLLPRKYAREYLDRCLTPAMINLSEEQLLLYMFRYRQSKPLGYVEYILENVFKQRQGFPVNDDDYKIIISLAAIHHREPFIKDHVLKYLASSNSELIDLMQEVKSKGYASTGDLRDMLQNLLHDQGAHDLIKNTTQLYNLISFFGKHNQHAKFEMLTIFSNVIKNKNEFSEIMSLFNDDYKKRVSQCQTSADPYAFDLGRQVIDDIWSDNKDKGVKISFGTNGVRPPTNT